jgi:hypothetical protein
MSANGRQTASSTALSRAAEKASQPLGLVHRSPQFGVMGQRSVFSSNSGAERRAPATRARAVSVPQAPFIGHLCPVCVEPLTIASDVIFCRRKCGQSVHRSCFASMRLKNCQFCGEGMALPRITSLLRTSRPLPKPTAMKIERPERTRARALRVPTNRRGGGGQQIPQIPETAVPMTLDGGLAKNRSRNHVRGTREHHFSWASLRQSSQRSDDGDIEMKTVN